MAKTDASFDWLWVNRSGTYYAPNGQSNLQQPQSRSTIETSDKASYPDKTYMVTERDRQVTLTIKPDYPDVNGVQWMETLWKGGTPELYRICSGGASSNGTANIIYQGSMVITQFNKSYNKGELRSIDIVLVPAAGATVDTLN